MEWASLCVSLHTDFIKHSLEKRDLLCPHTWLSRIFYLHNMNMPCVIVSLSQPDYGK